MRQTWSKPLQIYNLMEESENQTNNYSEVLENNLPGGAGGQQTVTKEQFTKMGYNDRLKLKKDNPELFNQLSH